MLDLSMMILSTQRKYSYIDGTVINPYVIARVTQIIAHNSCSSLFERQAPSLRHINRAT
jgi:hypothetical protein